MQELPLVRLARVARIVAHIRILSSRERENQQLHRPSIRQSASAGRPHSPRLSKKPQVKSGSKPSASNKIEDRPPGAAT